MLIHPTIENLKDLKLFGMARALESQMELKEARELSFEERLGLLIDAELVVQVNKRADSRLKAARLRLPATLEDLKLKASRGLDRSVITALATCDWILSNQNVLVTGATGAGKTYLACALAQKACREGYSVAYYRAPKFFDELALAKADGSYNKLLNSLKRKSLLVVDDFALSPLTEGERRDLLEVVEDRYGLRATIVASQLPVEHWHESIGEPTIADAILDRLVHNAHKIELKGKSMRDPKNETKQ